MIKNKIAYIQYTHTYITIYIYIYIESLFENTADKSVARYSDLEDPIVED